MRKLIGRNQIGFEKVVTMKINKNDVEKINLQDYIIPDKFRTVERAHYKLPHGIREIPVIIDLSSSTIKKLSFIIDEDMQIFGFATAVNKLLDCYDNVERIHVEPLDKEYMVLVVVIKGPDMYYYISEDELINLLEGAMRTQSQRSTE